MTVAVENGWLNVVKFNCKSSFFLG